MKFLLYSSALGMDWGVIDSAISAALGGNKAYGVHQKLLPNNVLIYEYVKNLDKLPPTGYTIYGLPLKIWNSCGGPVRMIAVKNPVSSGPVVKVAGVLVMLMLLVDVLTFTG